MKLTKLPSIDYLADQALTTARRFPAVILVAIAATIAAICHLEFYPESAEPKLTFTLLLGLPLFLASSFWRESKGWTGASAKLWEFVIGAALLTLHFVATSNDSTDAYAIRYLQLSLALHLIVAFSAFLHRQEGQGFWQLNKSIFLRILTSALYAAVFFAGLAIALLTVKALFALDISYTRFLELWFVSAILLQTWHFLAGLPKNLAALDQDDSYPRSLRVFVQYLLIPLVSLYMVILYFYIAKILATQSWPKGYVGWLVSVMSVLGVLNLLLIDPEKKHSERKWIATYQIAYYVSILPLLAMLLVAVGKRISEYGVTEPRYALAVLGGYLCVIALYFIFSRRKDIRIIPMSLCVLSLLTLVGPWSMTSVSKASQLARGREILERNQLLVGGKIRKNHGQTSSHDADELQSIARYLDQKHGAYAELFPNVGGYSDFENALGLSSNILAREYQRSSFSLYASTDEGLSVAGYDQVIVFKPDSRFRSTTLKGQKLEARLKEDSAQLIVSWAGREAVKIDLAPLVQKAREAQVGEDGRLAAAVLTTEAEGSGLKVKVAIDFVTGWKNADDKILVEGMNALILVR